MWVWGSGSGFPKLQHALQCRGVSLILLELMFRFVVFCSPLFRKPGQACSGEKVPNCNFVGVSFGVVGEDFVLVSACGWLWREGQVGTGLEGCVKILEFWFWNVGFRILVLEFRGLRDPN